MFQVNIRMKTLANRRFLIGPYCPIYGTTSLVMILLLKKYENDIVVLFFMGIVILSIIEYITSYIMEQIFNARWWDYSYRKFNINGRFCLINSLLFGLLCILLIKIINQD